jgi:hydrogenase expression/formation protein HypE
VFIAIVAPEAESEALEALHGHPLGRSASCVVRVSAQRPGAVLMTTRVGGTRVVDFPRGLLLPRIC